MINHHKVGKHILTTITDDSFSFARDLEKIAAEEELDGLYIVRSNVRVYPGRPDSTGVSLMSRGQDSELLSLDCWQMSSIYESS